MNTPLIILGLFLILIAFGSIVSVPQEKPYNYKESMRRIIMDKEPIENVMGEEIASCKCEPQGDTHG